MTPDHGSLSRVMGHPYSVDFVSAGYLLFLGNARPSAELVLGLLLMAPLKAEQSGRKCFISSPLWQ